jgi:hypothetical protein
MRYNREICKQCPRYQCFESLTQLRWEWHSEYGVIWREDNKVYFVQEGKCRFHCPYLLEHKMAGQYDSQENAVRNDIPEEVT